MRRTPDTPPRAELPPPERLRETIAQIVRGWMRLGREEARSFGLSLPQLLLLRALIELGEIPASRWAELVGAAPSTASGLLDGLEDAGFVRRTHGTRDRRQVLVSLTPQGRRVAQRLRQNLRREWTGYCRGLSSRELDGASTTLERVLAEMSPTKRGPPLDHPAAARGHR
ncbi:MAG: MarR family winged helix-turn-helix transcriptional regulator [Thermoplasmata archaeon]